jgi:acetolactate synthase I/II/III large subunit
LEITVAQAIANFCVEKESKVAFAVAGGASLHLIHAFAEISSATVVPLNHEQSVGMAVDGYSRASSSVGVGIVTSGPGITNLVTAIAGCYYDSVPAIFLAGQVSTFRMAGDSGVRQFGFQETPIAEILGPICKKVVQIYSGDNLRARLASAFEEAISGRQGPVVIEVPDDIQREMVEWSEPVEPAGHGKEKKIGLGKQVDEVLNLVGKARRPVVVAGAGVIRSKAEKNFLKFIDESGLPFVLTWGASGLAPSKHPNFVGYFGTHGDRHANFVIQNSDLVLSVGARLDTKATGTPMNSFAREATKIVVDIDAFELSKFERFGLKIELGIVSDAKTFLESLAGKVWRPVDPAWAEYRHMVQDACGRFEAEARKSDGVNPYEFVSELSLASPADLDVIVDTGCALPYVMSSFEVREGIRLFHDFNNTAMGWSIPATLGISRSNPARQTTTIVGDGSLLMGIHDLMSLSDQVPAAKVLLLDNSGYSMIKQTQDQWLGSKYFASSIESGLVFPDFEQLAKTFGFNFLRMDENQNSDEVIANFWEAKNPVFLQLKISPSFRVIPLVKAGMPNEDMEPPMDINLFSSLMLVPHIPRHP